MPMRDPNDPKRVRKHFGWVDEETGEFIPDPGRTKQEFRDETDINKIVKDITKRGATDWLEKHDEWLKGAASVVVPNIDYKTLMDQIADAENRFTDLPSAVRKGFDNDPAKFLDFVQSEGGDVELQELLAKALPIVEKKGSVGAASAPKEPAGKEPPAKSPTPPAEPPAEGTPPSSGE